VNEKHKEYARYAGHCLHMVTAAKDQNDRAIQREMAAEWLKLADAVLHPLKRGKIIQLRVQSSRLAEFGGLGMS
jgi:hypothetical protein